MKITTNPTIKELLDIGPDGILTWLETCKENQNKSTEFNWLGLAEATARRSRIELDRDLALAAIRVYEYWASLINSTAYELSHLSIMNLRAFFIKQLGAEKNDPVLDINLLISEFEFNLPYCIEEAKKLCDGWDKLEISKIRELRLIKDRLAPLKLLPIKILEEFPHIHEWLAIRNQLP